jgi:CRISPR system Cascade subunit CasA
MSGLSYNLIDEKWITCASRDGTQKMGLRDLLLNAQHLREIESPNPLIIAALLRVLLALIHRVLDGPRQHKDWVSLYSSGKFPIDRFDEYFNTYRARFDLFSETHPFYQTAELTNLDAQKNASPISAATIVMELASGNNKTIFDHSTDDIPPELTPEQAAQYLITCQCFALGGLNKKTTNLFGFQQSYLNASMVSGIFIALSGESLFETLMLNLLLIGSHKLGGNSEDKPVWERDGLEGDKARVPNGYLDYLTCKCRHIRLLPEKKNGAIIVSKIHIAQGEAFPDVTNPAFMRKKNQRTQEWYCPQLNPARLLWRDSTALFSFEQENDYRPAAFRQAATMQDYVSLPSSYQCMAIALANDKANPLAWRKEVLSIPRSLLEKEEVIHMLITGMARAEDSASILDNAVKTFVRNVLPPNSKDIAEKARATGAMRFFWDRLEHHFHKFISEIDEKDKSLNEWTNNLVIAAHLALKVCVRQRYTDSAETLKAWAMASDELNRKLAKVNPKK